MCHVTDGFSLCGSTISTGSAIQECLGSCFVPAEDGEVQSSEAVVVRLVVAAQVEIQSKAVYRIYVSSA
jgi:hypothetical protein